MNNLFRALQKIVNVMDTEQIPYMIVGGFAVNFYNRVRFTADIDMVIQIHPHHVEKIVKHFPDWQPFADTFKESTSRGQMFNLIDFDTGVKFDFMVYQDSDYNWTAFERRRKVDFLGIECMISTPEDLIISKLHWYSLSGSEKQRGDIAFLLEQLDLDRKYLELWSTRLFINRHGLF